VKSHYRGQQFEDDDERWLSEILRLARLPKRPRRKLSHDEAVIAAFVNGEDFETHEEDERLKLSHDEQVILDWMDRRGIFAWD